MQNAWLPTTRHGHYSRSNLSLVHDVAEISRRNNAPFLRLALEVDQPGVRGQRADQLGVLRVHGIPFLVEEAASPAVDHVYLELNLEFRI